MADPSSSSSSREEHQQEGGNSGEEWNPHEGFRMTYISTACALLEIGSLRILTDPVFDPPGRYYNFSLGGLIGSQKTEPAAPALTPDKLIGKVDLVLLSHDEHADNLDDAGREFLKTVPCVITTAPGARRLSPELNGVKVVGLEDWQSFELPFPASSSTSPPSAVLKITATPGRHGPPLSLPLVGAVIGFLLDWSSHHPQNGSLWISGDTVDFGGVREIGRRFKIGTAIVHLGAVGFSISTPWIHYTFTTEEAIDVLMSFDSSILKKVIPLHYEGWSHFQESKQQNQEGFRRTPQLAEKLVWLTPGTPTFIPS